MCIYFLGVGYFCLRPPIRSARQSLAMTIGTTIHIKCTMEHVPFTSVRSWTSSMDARARSSYRLIPSCGNTWLATAVANSAMWVLHYCKIHVQFGCNLIAEICLKTRFVLLHGLPEDPLNPTLQWYMWSKTSSLVIFGKFRMLCDEGVHGITDVCTYWKSYV